jgi:hypothetical protein
MSTLSKILKLAGDLTKHELLMLNQAIVALAKTREDEELFKASVTFQKGDIIFYIDGASNIKVHGVVTKKNPKTIQITTADNYQMNIPATHLKLEPNPSKKILQFKKELCLTKEDFAEVIFNLKNEN